MRIASSTIFAIGTSGVQNDTTELATLQEEISSGKDVNVPSDNPLAASEAVLVQQASDANTQYATNQSTASSQLQLEDSTLTSLSTALSSVQTLLVQAGDPSLTNQERSGLASQLQADVQQLVSLGNTTTATGGYLFGGFQSDGPPFSIGADGTVTYNGDAGQPAVQIAAGQSVAVGDPGSTLFQSVPFGTGPGVVSAAATNVGTTTASAVSVTNSADPSNADSYRLVFSVANGVTTYSVLDTTTATLLNGGVPQSYTSGDAISLGGQSITLTGVPADGDQFTVTPANSAGTTLATAAASANVGSGTIGAVTVTNPADPSSAAGYSIAFSVVAGVTSYVVTNTTTGLTAPAAPYTDPTTVALGTGATVQISGAPANGDTFTVTPQNVGVNAFSTLNQVITALQQPVSGSASQAALTNVLTTAQAQLANTSNAVLTLRAQVGGRQQTLSTVQTDTSTAQLQDTSTLSSLTDTNIVQAYSQYTQTSVALQAAEKTFVQTESLSLFSIIQ